MSSDSTGFDTSASQFSPDGKIFQVEYGQNAVLKSATTIGLRGQDCVVLAGEKVIISKLHESETNNRIFTIDQHIGVSAAGYFPDARHIVEMAKTEASNFRQHYGHCIPIDRLKLMVAAYMHTYTLYGSLRPFGANALMASWDLDGPQLTCFESAGESYRYFGWAIGKGHQAAKTEIEALKLNQMTPEQLVKEAAKIIYLVHDEARDKEFELELSWVGRHTLGKHVHVPRKIFEEADSYGKTAVEEASSSEEI